MERVIGYNKDGKKIVEDIGGAVHTYSWRLRAFHLKHEAIGGKNAKYRSRDKKDRCYKRKQSRLDT